MWVIRDLKDKIRILSVEELSEPLGGIVMPPMVRTTRMTVSVSHWLPMALGHAMSARQPLVWSTTVDTLPVAMEPMMAVPAGPFKRPTSRAYAYATYHRRTGSE